ncbi:Tat pathway signal protein [Leptolyngbya sp. 'hensonii']|uniref:ferritin-like domain-containing protein n=1 Tax=Leptolyngbya sp. 'hensonii' TaxID=1922337 RepID=UPI00094FF562|nr:ferritin-like domain-containing protein [Leptolyngbya sp. 'hensonii']OLP19635.1 Tat pathway signal protein [Leptolyngbya sp. 'hensonii']
MENERFMLSGNLSRRRTQFSRRDLLMAGTITGVLGGLTLPTLVAQVAHAAPADKKNDIKILNNALYYEHQAIWAYGFAAGKLSSSDVGKAVLALALRNQADHKQHRDALAAAVRSLGGKPVMAEASYDVSSYIKNQEGNLDNDVNIAKLALALEVDAAIAYTQEVAKLKTPALITAGASIGSTESAHAAAIRATFKALGVGIEIVPAALVSANSRTAWVLKV